MFLVLKLLTLVFLVFCFYLGPGLSSAPAAPPSARSIALAVGLAALVFLGLERFAPPGLDKSLTVLAFCVTLIGPGVFVGMRVSTWFEQRDLGREREALVRRLISPGHTHELALYLLSRSGDTRNEVAGATEREVEHIERYVLSLAPQELREHSLVESLLLGLQIQTDPRLHGLPSPEALCRLYLKVKERSGFSPADAPFYLRHRDRLVTRLAELGQARWLEEIGHEHVAFQSLVRFALFSEALFRECVPQPLAPGEQPVSRSLGSLPLHVVVALNLEHFPSPPGLEQPSSNPSYDEYKRVSALNETREALAVMKARGVDFTEEERRDPGLQAFLETVRTAPPPPPP